MGSMRVDTSTRRGDRTRTARSGIETQGTRRCAVPNAPYIGITRSLTGERTEKLSIEAQ